MLKANVLHNCVLHADMQLVEMSYFVRADSGHVVKTMTCQVVEKCAFAEVQPVTVSAGFIDPFHYDTVTLDNPAYRYLGFSLMKGKLDWLLLRKLQVLNKSIGNHKYAASDHKWLSASVQLK